MLLRALVVVSSVFATSALAQAPAADVPSPDAVKSVWNFFNKGQGKGVVLGDVKLCTEVGKEGETKFECTVEVGPEGVKAGTTVLVWQAYLVPNGDVVENVAIQLKQGNTVRETKDLKLKGESLRVRTWTGFRIPKPGEWTIVLMQGDQTLKELKVKAN